MALQVHKARSFRFLNKLCVQFVAACDKRDVHQGAVLRDNRATEHLRVVEIAVQDAGFLFVQLLHFLQAADGVFDPIEHQHADVDRIARRCIEHGAVVHMRLIVEHGGRDVHRMAN